MKVLMITRATLYSEPGGDTIQIRKTAAYLRELGVEIDLELTDKVMDYASYDLLHFFNITRPADILIHIRRSKKPFVVSPIFIEYTEFDRYFRKGISGILFKMFQQHTIEYLKVLARRIFNGEKIMSPEYIYWGQKKSIRQILAKASFLLPNSYNEMKRLQNQFAGAKSFAVIPNGIDESVFPRSELQTKDNLLVLCVARIEGIKNQLNLIKALSGSRFRLLVIGKPAHNQMVYWKACKHIAADNIQFLGNLPQEALVKYYKEAKVHILPSWFETTGLSSLEAASMGCNIVITNRGDAKEYFESDALYCDPDSPGSIFNAIEKAAAREPNDNLRNRVYEQYTWKITAIRTLEIYNGILKKNKVKIGILGTRGIPNQYGGFEQFASYLSEGLVNKGHDVYVYNSHNHSYQEDSWNDVKIVHCYDPEYKIGSAGQFIYDLNCILDARNKNFDIILMLGYTSSSIWGKLYPKKSTILFNMDGMEWKRNKYSVPVKKFLFYAEKLAVKYSDFVVADSEMIQSYIEEKYTIPTRYIPYGAQIFNHEDEQLLKAYRISPFNYFVSMGRMVCENNLEMILDGFTSSNTDKKFLVISNPENKFGKHLVTKYESDKRIVFTGAIYEEKHKHTLKFFSRLYFHGHSVGGTNPCLLEAMASRSLIAAHDNVFNKSVLGDDGFYFTSAQDIRLLVEQNERPCGSAEMINNNLQKIRKQFNWERIIEQYENFMLECCNQ